MSLKPLKFVFTSLANIPGSSNELVDCTELADKPTKCLQINKFLKVTVFEVLRHVLPPLANLVFI